MSAAATLANGFWHAIGAIHGQPSSSLSGAVHAILALWLHTPMRWPSFDERSRPAKVHHSQAGSEAASAPSEMPNQDRDGSGHANHVHSLESAVGKDLELQARSILHRPRPPHDPGDPLETIEQEMALILGQIDQARSLHGALSESLLRNECSLDTELMQMEQRTPRYSPYKYPEREKFQRRLLEIERERRTNASAHMERVQRLHERLLGLLNRHASLDL